MVIQDLLQRHSEKWYLPWSEIIVEIKLHGVKVIKRVRGKNQRDIYNPEKFNFWRSFEAINLPREKKEVTLCQIRVRKSNSGQISSSHNTKISNYVKSPTQI